MADSPTRSDIDYCSYCQKEIDFKVMNIHELKEHVISGLCQECQYADGP